MERLWQSELTQRLEASRGTLLATVAAVPADRWEQRPEAGAWSPAEILEHVAGAERYFAHVVGKLVERGESDPGLAADPAAARDWEAALVRRFGPGRRFRAPEGAEPKGGVAQADALAWLAKSRQRLIGYLDRLAALDTDRLVATHPLGFELNALQWIDLAAWHEERHAAQMRRASSFAPAPDPRS